MFVYTVLNGLIAFTVWISCGRLEPREYDMKEYWSWKGSGQAPWFIRAARKRKCFGNKHDEDDGTSKRSLNMNEENESSYGDPSRTEPSGQGGEVRDEIAIVSSPQQ